MVDLLQNRPAFQPQMQPGSYAPSGNYFNRPGADANQFGNSGNAAFGTPANVQKNRAFFDAAQGSSNGPMTKPAWSSPGSIGGMIGNAGPGFTGDNNNIGAPGTSFNDALRRFGPGGAGSIGASIGNSVGGAVPQGAQPAQPAKAAPAGGFQRVSAGLYQGPDGKLVRSAQNPARQQNVKAAPAAAGPLQRQPGTMPNGAMGGMTAGIGAGAGGGSNVPGSASDELLTGNFQRPGGPGPQTGGPLVSALGGIDQQPRNINWDQAIAQRQQMGQSQGVPGQNMSLTRMMPDGRMVY